MVPSNVSKLYTCKLATMYVDMTAVRPAAGHWLYLRNVLVGLQDCQQGCSVKLALHVSGCDWLRGMDKDFDWSAGRER